MKLAQTHIGISLFVLLMAVGLVVAACAPNANATLISPDLGEQLYAAEAGQQVQVEPTPTPVPFASLSQEQVTAGLPEDFAGALANADPSAGETVAVANGCIGCHALDPEAELAGPTWNNMADTAANRQEDMSPANYLYTSIVEPNAYIVDGFQSGVMPQNFSDTIPQEDLANLVAYLLTLHQ